MTSGIVGAWVQFCFVVGATISVLATFAAMLWIIERICDFAYRRMQCAETFLLFLIHRRRRHGKKDNILNVPKEE